MSLSDLARNDLGDLLAGDLAEVIQYAQLTPAGLQPWRSIQAIVERGDAETPLSLGSSDRSGPPPAQVYISKDSALGVAEVNPRGDRLRLDPGTAREREYSVAAILDSNDPAAWRLHAVA